MKLNEYAKKTGLSYDTVYAYFQKGQIPGAYQMATGTIIVPDMLTNEADHVAIGLQQDLTSDEDGKSTKKPMSQTDMLRAQLEAMQVGAAANNPSFSPADFMNAGQLLPKSTVKAHDYEAEWDASYAKCLRRVQGIVSNFIQDEAQLSLFKVSDMIEEHAERLCELMYASASIKKTLFAFNAAMDAGEPVERVYELQATYLTQLQNASNNRAKHLSNVEEYWAGEAARLGIQDEQSKVQEEQQAVDDVQQAADEQLFTADARTINDSVEDIMKRLAEEGFTGKSK